VSVLIQIGDDLRLVSNGRMYILQERKSYINKKTAAPYDTWSDMRFYPHFNALLDQLPDEVARRSDAHSFKELFHTIEHYKKIIRREVKGLRDTEGKQTTTNLKGE